MKAKTRFNPASHLSKAFKRAIDKIANSPSPQTKKIKLPPPTE